MFDSPPPSTMTSGSSRLITLAERARHALLVPRQRRVGQRIARRRARRDLLRRQRSRLRCRRSRAPAPAPTETFRCSRSARSSTAARATRRRARAGSGLCPHSPPIAFAPTSTWPMDHHAAAGAGADDDAEDDGGAGRRAVGRLRQREAVGVVGEPDRPIEQARQILGQRPAVQPGRVRVLDQSGRRRDRAGNADADACRARRVACSMSSTRPAHRGQRVRVVAARRRDPPSQPLASRRRQSRCLRSWCRPGRCQSACLRQSYIAS